MPQTAEVSVDTLRGRLAKVQAAMREYGLRAVLLEPGPAMLWITGVRWGRSERTFAVVLTQVGEPGYVLPGFEEARARELIKVGSDLRIWQEDESPFQRIAELLKNRAVNDGKVGIEDSMRFFVFDGIRKQASRYDYVSAQPALASAGVDLAPPAGRGAGRKQ